MERRSQRSQEMDGDRSAEERESPPEPRAKVHTDFLQGENTAKRKRSPIDLPRHHGECRVPWRKWPPEHWAHVSPLPRGFLESGASNQIIAQRPPLPGSPLAFYLAALPLYPWAVAPSPGQLSGSWRHSVPLSLCTGGEITVDERVGMAARLSAICASLISLFSKAKR